MQTEYQLRLKDMHLAERLREEGARQAAELEAERRKAEATQAEKVKQVRARGLSAWLAAAAAGSGRMPRNDAAPAAVAALHPSHPAPNACRPPASVASERPLTCRATAHAQSNEHQARLDADGARHAAQLAALDTQYQAKIIAEVERYQTLLAAHEASQDE